MLRTEKSIERVVKKILNTRHQEVFGKGPEELLVKVNRETITFYCARKRTNVEDYLLSIGGTDKNLLLSFYTEIGPVLNTQICTAVEMAIGVKVLGMAWEHYDHGNIVFGVFLLQEYNSTVRSD